VSFNDKESISRKYTQLTNSAGRYLRLLSRVSTWAEVSRYSILSRYLSFS